MSQIQVEEVSDNTDGEKFYDLVGKENPGRDLEKSPYPSDYQDGKIVVVSLVILVLNIFLMGMVLLPERQETVLPNGDKVVKCGKLCFEVVDHLGTPVYRSDRDKRSLSLRPCQDKTLEGCVGEYQFSQNSSVHWTQQLYEVNGSRSLVIAATNDRGEPIPQSFRMRYMLQPPYNWIVSKHHLPPDSHSGSAVFVQN